MREPDEANCAKNVGSTTVSVKCKLIIRDVTHYFEKKCTHSSNERPLNSLSRKVVVGATAMKKAHKKFVFVLINLI